MTNKKDLNINLTPLSRIMDISKAILEPALQNNNSDCLLLFGLPGAGKTIIAKALGYWLVKRFPLRKTAFIDCDMVSTLPDVNNDKAFSLLVPWLQDILSLSKTSEYGWIIIARSLDSLFASNPNSRIIGNLLNKLIELLSTDSPPSIIIGTACNPDAIDPVILSRFSKRLYVRPSAIFELPDWLNSVSCIDKKISKKVVKSVTKLLEGMNLDYIAPAKLTKCLDERIQNTLNDEKNEPDDIARSICSIIPDLFINTNTKEQFEEDSHRFINDSDFLETIINQNRS